MEATSACSALKDYQRWPWMNKNPRYKEDNLKETLKVGVVIATHKCWLAECQGVGGLQGFFVVFITKWFRGIDLPSSGMIG